MGYDQKVSGLATRYTAAVLNSSTTERERGGYSEPFDVDLEVLA
jgi:hypothetical protein